MPQFRKKPVIIEAKQLTLDTRNEVLYWLDLNGVDYALYNEKVSITLKTLEGYMRAVNSDWIIKGIQGEFYPCKPEIFDATYEEVNSELDAELQAR